MTASTYIRTLRNDSKRVYAAAYWQFLRDDSPDGQEPDRGELSYMAAQAVRLTLTEIERTATL